MLKEEYGNRAELLIARIENRIKVDKGEEKKDSIEKEQERLYNWIISELSESMEDTIPALDYYHMRVKAGTREGKWCLLYGKQEYTPAYVEMGELYNVMAEISVIFNRMQKFSAKYTPPEIYGKMVVKNAMLEVYINLRTS